MSDAERGNPRTPGLLCKAVYGCLAGLGFALAAQCFLLALGIAPPSGAGFVAGLSLGTGLGMALGISTGTRLCQAGPGTAAVIGLIYAPFGLYLANLSLDPSLVDVSGTAVLQTFLASILVLLTPLIGIGLLPVSILVCLGLQWALQQRRAATPSPAANRAGNSAGEQTVSIPRPAPGQLTAAPRRAKPSQRPSPEISPEPSRQP